MKYAVLFVNLITLMALADDFKCPSENILRLAVRASCDRSNTSENCQSLLAFEGTAAAGAVALAAGKNNDAKIVNEYLKGTRSLMNKLRHDYKKVVEAYYKLKKQSSTPAEFANPSYEPNITEEMKKSYPAKMLERMSKKTVSSMADLNVQELEIFEKQLKADPNLKDNEFLKQYDIAMKKARNGEIGVGTSADIVMSALEDYQPKQMSKSLRGLTNLLVGSPMARLNIIRMSETFHEVSKSNGFANNGSFISAERKLDYVDESKSGRKDLRAEIGSPPPPTRLQKLVKMMPSSATAVGLGIGAGSSIASVAAPHAAVKACADQLGVTVSQEDVLKISKAIVANGFVDKKGCDQLFLSEEGTRNLVEAISTYSPAANQFFCKMEEQLAKKQDEQIKLDLEKLAGSPSQCEEYFDLQTSKGAVRMRTLDDGRIAYNSTKPADGGFRAYLNGKIQYSNLPEDRLRANINPKILCDGRQNSGENEKAFCELSQGINARNQLYVFDKIRCAMQSENSSSSKSKSENSHR